MSAAPPEISALQRAFAGSWAGTLEYRDYSESAASSKARQAADLAIYRTRRRRFALPVHL